jgi:hypothetical protein
VYLFNIKDQLDVGYLFQIQDLHNILEPTTGVTFFNSGFKSDPTDLFPSIV